MLLKLTGQAEKIQLFEISDNLFDELKSNEELRKEFKIPYVKSEEGKTWTELPSDFKYKNENECKEVFSTIINTYADLNIGDELAMANVECMEWEEGVEYKQVEEKFAFDDKKYLKLNRTYFCGTHPKRGQKGSLGIIDTGEEAISLNSGFSLVKKRLWFGPESVEDGLEVSYKKDQYGKLDQYIFDEDNGSSSFIIEKGKIADYWSTLAQHEMKEE
tara:strand:+ start:175 stop:825 length:651 start_codon:yes stop_codon:yes gene_type:complete